MRMTVPQIAASRTSRAVKDLLSAANSTLPDKVTWSPLGDARSALSMLTECVIANQKWRDILRNRTYADVSEELWEQVTAACTDLQSTLAQLEKAGEELEQAILAIPDDETGDEIETPWGRYSLADCCLHAYWNMVYHEGQINYIQTLYGDHEEHY